MTGDSTSSAPGPLPRPTLLPGLRCLWRGRHRLQLGVDPARAVVLELPDPTTARLLDLLDGSRSERMVLAAAGRCGIREPDAQALLRSLQRAGFVVAAPALLPAQLPEPLRRRLAAEAAALALRATGSGPGTGTDTGTGASASAAPGTPAQILRRRSAARVVVTGHGPLTAPVALTLAQAGVGHVRPRVERPPAISHPPVESAIASPGAVSPGAALPGEEIAAAIARVAPGTRTGPLRRRDATFVVQVGTTGPANLAAAGYAQHRLAHLPVSVRDGTVVVGPLVPPAGGPCLNCIDLHRRDRDPDWPELAAQLAAPGSDPCAIATALSAAGLAAGEVLRWLDGETPDTLGASVEVAAPGRLRRRSWPPHPRCPCFRHHRRTRPRS